MKKIVFALLIMFSIPALAQRIDKPGEPYDYFIQIRVEQKFTSDIKAKINLPGDKKYRFLVDENNKKIVFMGLDEIINYMTRRGWTYVDYKNYINEELLLFRKNVKNNTQVKEYICVEKE